jgi:hypothetical protein
VHREGDAESKRLCKDVVSMATHGYECDPDGVFRPPICKNAPLNCTVQLLHASPSLSSGVLEKAVILNKLPATIAYVGVECLHGIAFQIRHDVHRNDLIFWYIPSLHVGGIPVGEMAKVAWRFGGLTTTMVYKLQWPGLHSEAIDAHHFARKFELSMHDYTKLAYSVDQGDAFASACQWIKMC